MDKLKIGYIVGCYPDKQYTIDVLNKLDNSNLDILEIGIPYSDPISDGELITSVSQSANINGFHADDVFDAIKNSTFSKKISLLVYYNIIYMYGTEKFIKMCRDTGVSMLIIPDLPYEENEEIYRLCLENNINLVPIISITSTEKRIKNILTRSGGFVYLVGSLGTTGDNSRKISIDDLQKTIKLVKQKTELPVCIGFGIKSKDDVVKYNNISDGSIIGTTIVKMQKTHTPTDLVKEISDLFN